MLPAFHRLGKNASGEVPSSRSAALRSFLLRVGLAPIPRRERLSVQLAVRREISPPSLIGVENVANFPSPFSA
jgi:hypothetical protein